MLKFEKNSNYNIKYLPNGREYLNSANTGESGVKNWICLNYFRFLGPIAELEKKEGSMDLVRLSGGLLVKNQNFVHQISGYLIYPVLPQSRLKNNRDQTFDRIFNLQSNLFKMILIAFRRPKNHFWEFFFNENEKF